METIDLSCEEGQNTLIVEIHTLAHRIAKRMARRERAEDAAQNVVLYCLKRLREGRWDIGDRALDSHIGYLVRRQLRNLKRPEIPELERDYQYWWDRESTVHEWMDPELELEAAEIDAFREATLAKLTPACRTAFELVRNRDLSYAAAGAELGISADTVKKHIVSAQRAFRAALRERGMRVPPEMAPRPEKPKGWRRRRRNRPALVG